MAQQATASTKTEAVLYQPVLGSRRFSNYLWATVSAIGFASPLFAALLAILFLGEKVGVRRWTGLIIGFIGTIIILRPGAGVIETGALVALASSAEAPRDLSRFRRPVAVPYPPDNSHSAARAALGDCVRVAVFSRVCRGGQRRREPTRETLIGAR